MYIYQAFPCYSTSDGATINRKFCFCCNNLRQIFNKPSFDAQFWRLSIGCISQFHRDARSNDGNLQPSTVQYFLICSLINAICPRHRWITWILGIPRTSKFIHRHCFWKACRIDYRDSILSHTNNTWVRTWIGVVTLPIEDWGSRIMTYSRIALSNANRPRTDVCFLFKCISWLTNSLSVL